eukprot:Gregarina_sp_Poly_1__621@NODE_1147_length_4945_cov_9_941369_g791_i0_p1_GENE_NODE_1147_length_4945_cov_9_941369_g791_i0NODE_1147_length_4945_cov_9_941369_g791_i0_p1_ORF_typecomplete_len218_score25_37_NODE_1147_length_4945_cov_9_941369_g791_i013461999
MHFLYFWIVYLLASEGAVPVKSSESHGGVLSDSEEQRKDGILRPKARVERANFGAFEECGTRGEFCTIFKQCREDPESEICGKLEALAINRGFKMILDDRMDYRKLARKKLQRYLVETASDHEWTLLRRLGIRSDEIRKHFPKRRFCTKSTTLCRSVNRVMYSSTDWQQPSKDLDLLDVLKRHTNGGARAKLRQEDDNPEGKQTAWNKLFKDQEYFP